MSYEHLYYPGDDAEQVVFDETPYGPLPTAEPRSSANTDQQQAEAYRHAAVNVHPSQAVLAIYEVYTEYQLGQLSLDGDRHARTVLYERHSKRIAHHANRLYDHHAHGGGSMDADDVRQEVAALMLESITSWTPEGNNRVQASHYESEHATHIAERKGFSASLDKVHARYIAELAAINNQRAAQNVAPLTKCEIAERFRLPSDPSPGRPNQYNAHHLLQAWQLTRGSTSFDAAKPFMAEQAYDPFEYVGNNAHMAREINKALHDLTEHQRTVITSYYGLGCHPQTLEELSNQLGWSKAYIRQVRDHVLTILRASDVLAALYKEHAK